MEIGHLKQKANPIVSVFVMICMIVTTGLLFILQKSISLGNAITEKSGISSTQSY